MVTKVINSILTPALGLMWSYDLIEAYQLGRLFEERARHNDYDQEAASFYMKARKVINATLLYGSVYLFKEEIEESDSGQLTFLMVTGASLIFVPHIAKLAALVLTDRYFKGERQLTFNQLEEIEASYTEWNKNHQLF